MQVFERHGRLWIEHEAGDPYHGWAPQPTNIQVGPPREIRDRALYESAASFAATVTDSMLACKVGYFEHGQGD